MNTHIVGAIAAIETIAEGNRIRERALLRQIENQTVATMNESNEFVLCVNNADFGDFSAADLMVGKCYEGLAREEGWLRIVDESGEDYLYPVARFVPVARSPEAADRFRQGLEQAVA